MEVSRTRAKTLQRGRRVHVLDRRAALAGALVPLRNLEAAAHEQQTARGPEIQHRRRVGLIEAVRRLILCRRLLGADSVEPDVGRLAPAADRAQRRASIEEARREKRRLDALVALDCETAADVDEVVRAHVPRVARAEREPTARVRALEERMDVELSGEQRRFGAIEE